MSKTRKLIDKIKKLLRLSSSANENESKLAMEKAQELMLRNNIDEGAVRASDIAERVAEINTPDEEDWYHPISRVLNTCFCVVPVRDFDLPRERGEKGDVFDIRLFGRDVNVEIGYYVYKYLSFLFPHLAESNNVPLMSRQEYFFGLADGIIENLKSARDAVANDKDLVLVDDLPVIKKWLENELQANRYQAGSGSRLSEAYSDGMSEGGNIRINPGVRHEGQIGRIE